MVIPPAPDLARRVKYDRSLSPLLTAYVLGQYLLLVVAIFAVLLLRHDAPRLPLALACVAIFAGIEAVAGLVEGRRWAPWAEAGRLAIGIAALVTWTARA